MGMIKRVCIGALFSIFLTFVFIVIFSVLMVKTNISESYIDTIVAIISCVSILIGATIATKSLKKNGAVVGLLIAVFYTLFLYLLSSIIMQNFSIEISAIYMIISNVIFGIIGGIIGINIKK